MHREIMLSADVSIEHGRRTKQNFAQDPANRLLWRANLQQRLDAEALRDSLLAVSGELDLSMGGPSIPLGDENRRRTVYALIGRTKPDAELALFDFPNPNATSEQRMVTVGPMQRLYFMNNGFVAKQAKALADRLAKRERRLPPELRGRIGCCLGASRTHLRFDWGWSSLRRRASAWPQYMQVLLTSTEFSSVN